jgi:hypothetical protein
MSKRTVSAKGEACSPKAKRPVAPHSAHWAAPSPYRPSAQSPRKPTDPRRYCPLGDCQGDSSRSGPGGSHAKGPRNHERRFGCYEHASVSPFSESAVEKAQVEILARCSSNSRSMRARSRKTAAEERAFPLPLTANIIDPPRNRYSRMS